MEKSVPGNLSEEQRDKNLNALHFRKVARDTFSQSLWA